MESFPGLDGERSVPERPGPAEDPHRRPGTYVTLPGPTTKVVDRERLRRGPRAVSGHGSLDARSPVRRSLWAGLGTGCAWLRLRAGGLAFPGWFTGHGPRDAAGRGYGGRVAGVGGLEAPAAVGRMDVGLSRSRGGCRRRSTRAWLSSAAPWSVKASPPVTRDRGLDPPPRVL